MYPRDTPGTPAPDGAAAEAIRDAEISLARQGSVVAQVDLQVVTAVLSAHAARADGAAQLDALQHEIEAAVQSRTDLDTPAGARSFQQYLVEKIRDIRDVVESTELESTSKAGLAAAMASLYASSGQSATDAAPQAEVAAAPAPAPAPAPVAPAVAGGDLDGPPDAPADPAWDLPPLGDATDLPPMEVSPEPPTTAAPAPPTPMAAPAGMPGWTGGAPAAGMPLGGAGLPPLSIPPLSPLGADTAASRLRDPEPVPERADEPTDDSRPAEDPVTAEGAASHAELQPGDPDPELAQVISAAVSGTPIADAFAERGIDIPDPGSVVRDPVDPADLVAGDVGVFTDRHALALGNDKALLDNQIQAIASVNRPGFIGWHHPLAGSSETSTPPESPAPSRPAETADQRSE